MNAAEIAHALGGKRSGKSFMCWCPAHEDRAPSLSLTEGDRAPLLKCFAGCDSRDVIDACAGMGLWDTRAVAFAPALRRARSNGPTTKPTDSDASPWRAAFGKAARDPRGTLAEQYLNGRGLELPPMIFAGACCGFIRAAHGAWRDGARAGRGVSADQRA